MLKTLHNGSGHNQATSKNKRPALMDHSRLTGTVQYDGFFFARIA